MFRDLNPRVQGFGCVVRQNWDFSLRDDVSVINLFVDVVNGAPGNRLSRGQRLFPRFETRKSWQERRVNINDAP